jgi:hypothetical protein
MSAFDIAGGGDGAALAALFAFGRFLGTRFLRRRFGGRKLDYYLAGYRVSEPESAALVFESGHADNTYECLTWR